LIGEKKVFYRENIIRKSVSLFVFRTFLQIPHGNNKIEAGINSLDLVIENSDKGSGEGQVRASLRPRRTL